MVHWASFTAVGLELDLVHVPCSTQPVERVKVGIDVVAPCIVRRMECLSLLVRAAEAAAEVEVPVLVLVLAPTTIT